MQTQNQKVVNEDIQFPCSKCNIKEGFCSQCSDYFLARADLINLIYRRLNNNIITNDIKSVHFDFKNYLSELPPLDDNNDPSNFYRSVVNAIKKINAIKAKPAPWQKVKTMTSYLENISHVINNPHNTHYHQDLIDDAHDLDRSNLKSLVGLTTFIIGIAALVSSIVLSFITFGIAAPLALASTGCLATIYGYHTFFRGPIINHTKELIKNKKSMIAKQNDQAEKPEYQQLAF